MQDKRRLERWHLIYYLQVVDCGTGEALGHVVDISVEGLMLISREPVAPGRDFTLRMRMPLIDGVRECITLEARSRWSRRDLNTDFYDTGFKLAESSPATVRQIQALIDEVHFDGPPEISIEETYFGNLKEGTVRV